MSVNIRIEPRGRKFDIVGESEVIAIKHRLEDTIKDLADSLKDIASVYAPISDPDDKAGGSASHIPSGTLKENPADIDTSRSFLGIVENITREAEGYRSIRAPAGAIDPITGEKIGGRFVRGKGFSSEIGHVFYTATISYPKHPFYAKFVAFGTRGHGPRTAKYMKFRYKGVNYRAKYVRGQSAQPYLEHAFNSGEFRGTLERKISELRAEANAIT